MTVRGLIANGTAGASAFTLPAGYRPSNTLLFVGVDGANASRRITVESTGTITPVAGSNNGFFSINFSFYAA